MVEDKEAKGSALGASTGVKFEEVFKAAKGKRCPYCQEMNSINATTCGRCGRSI